MFELFGSKSKTKVFLYLSKNPNKTTNEIAKDTDIKYKYLYKILQEFLELHIIEKNGTKYALTPHFVEFYRKNSEVIAEKYIDNIYMRNKLDLYNAFCSLEDDKQIKSKVDKILDDWFYNKLDEWYSKYYDPNKIEYKKIVETIKAKFKSKSINVLEVGCGTGRLSFDLVKDYKNLTSIDSSKQYIEFCNKKAKKKGTSVNFVNSDIHNFKSNHKYNVIIFSWIGLHYQYDIDKIFKAIYRVRSDDCLILILDAYYDTEYIKILQFLRETDMNHTKLKKEELHEKLVAKYGSISQDVVKTHYKFDSLKSVIDTFKIELTLEESHIWTKKDEENLKKYLSKKSDPLVIEEGFTFVKVDLNK